jgi:hypothetical protein
MNATHGRALTGAMGAVLAAVLLVGCSSDERSVESMQDVKVVAREGDEVLAEVRAAIDEAIGPVTWTEKHERQFSETGDVVDGTRLERYVSPSWIVDEPLVADTDRWTAALQATEATLKEHGYSTETQILGTEKHAVVVWHDDTGRSIELGSSKATVLNFESGPQLGEPYVRYP